VKPVPDKLPLLICSSILLAGDSSAVSIPPVQSIQSAFDSAHPEDTIEISSGIYHESLRFKILILKGIDSEKGSPILNPIKARLSPFWLMASPTRASKLSHPAGGATTLA